MESVIDVLELGSLDLSEAGECFRSFLRGVVRETVMAVMAEEVTSLCGPRYAPDGSGRYRAGSCRGSVLVNGRRVDVERPRVRRRKADGSTEEVRLVSYAAAQDPAELHERMLLALLTGVPSREQKRLHGDSTRGTSRSDVSRLWKREGSKFLEALRCRDLGDEDWLVLMVDGISLGGDLLAVVGMGITRDGRKVLLDFEIGSSESYEVCKGLLQRIVSRGFSPMAGHCLFAVTDGSPAIRKAIVKMFPGTQMQRCLVHKERNLRGYLSKRHWGELARLFKRLRQAQGEEAGREALRELREFVGAINAAALASIDEAGDDLIRMHILNVPSTLASTLLNTNAIENSFLNVRRKIGRVKRWRADTDQPSRWLAYALTEAQRGFRRISGYESLAELAKALELPREEEDTGGAADARAAAATPLRPTASAPLQRRPLTR